MGQSKIWVPDRNRTHGLPNTGRALYSVGFNLNLTYGLKPQGLQVSSIKIVTVYLRSIFRIESHDTDHKDSTTSRPLNKVKPCQAES